MLANHELEYETESYSLSCSESWTHGLVFSPLCWLKMQVFGRRNCFPLLASYWMCLLTHNWSAFHFWTWFSVVCMLIISSYLNFNHNFFLSICSSVCCIHQATLTKVSASSLFAQLFDFHRPCIRWFEMLFIILNWKKRQDMNSFSVNNLIPLNSTH